jgi:hypothetical protein
MTPQEARYLHLGICFGHAEAHFQLAMDRWRLDRSMGRHEYDGDNRAWALAWRDRVKGIRAEIRHEATQQAAIERLIRESAHV